MTILDKLTSLEIEAADFGFKWETTDQIKAQILSELNEINAHLKDENKEKLQEEIGDLLHAVFSLCVFCKLDPKVTLEKSVKKFERRFTLVKQLAKLHGLDSLHGKSFDELMYYWNSAKEQDS